MDGVHRSCAVKTPDYNFVKKCKRMHADVYRAYHMVCMGGGGGGGEEEKGL